MTRNKLQTIPGKRIAQRVRVFPGYARILRCVVLDQPRVIESGMKTHTLKLCRQKIPGTCQSGIGTLYAG